MRTNLESVINHKCNQLILIIIISTINTNYSITFGNNFVCMNKSSMHFLVFINFYLMAFRLNSGLASSDS